MLVDVPGRGLVELNPGTGHAFNRVTGYMTHNGYHRTWFSAETAQLRYLWTKYPANVVARKLRRSVNSVVGKARLLNLPRKDGKARKGDDQWTSKSTASNTA
jgi:hypothetical protein